MATILFSLIQNVSFPCVFLICVRLGAFVDLAVVGTTIKSRYPSQKHQQSQFVLLLQAEIKKQTNQETIRDKKPSCLRTILFRTRNDSRSVAVYAIRLMAYLSVKDLLQRRNRNTEKKEIF